MCAGIKAGKLLQYFGASRRLESNNSVRLSLHYAPAEGLFIAPFRQGVARIYMSRMW
jgi:hypothetical protein